MPGDTVSIKLAAKTSELERLYGIVESFGQAHNLPADAIFQINLTLEEIVSNSIKYGYQDGNEHAIDLHMSFISGTIFIQVEDDGSPFNMLEAPAPDLQCSCEERPVGGLGIHLARTLMDHVEYERREDKNILYIKKVIFAENSRT